MSPFPLPVGVTSTRDTRGSLVLSGLLAAAVLLPAAGAQTMETTITGDDLLPASTPMASLDDDLLDEDSTDTDSLLTNITFLRESGETLESAGTATVDVEAGNDSQVFPANVTYDVTGGAADDADYDGGEGTLEFTEAGQVLTIPLDLHDDTAYEGDETVVLNLSSDDLHVTFGIQEHTHTLVDDDPPNEPPSAPDAAAFTEEDIAYTATLPGSDPDGDVLVWSIETHPGQGSLTLDADTGAFTYAPDPGFAGTDSFTYRVFDGLASDTGRIDVTVEAVDDGTTPDDETTSDGDTTDGGDGTSDGDTTTSEEGATTDGASRSSGFGATGADGEDGNLGWWVLVGLLLVVGAGGALGYGYYRSQHGGFY